MKKDPRIASIQWGDTVEKCLYFLFMIFLIVLAVADSNGLDAGHLFMGCAAAMTGIRIRIEMRNARLDAIRRENVDRADRAGLAMPRLYEDVEDLREAIHNMRFKNAPPSQNAAR